MPQTLNSFQPKAGDYLQFERLRQPPVDCRNITQRTPVTAPVLVTGGDTTLDAKIFGQLDTPSLKLWLAQNCLHRHPKLVSLPLGLADNRHDPVLGNTETFRRVGEQTQTDRNLVYVGFRDETAGEERQKLRALLAHKTWVTSTPYDRTPDGFGRYLDNVYNHVFVLSPRGNGIDCHRTWETLYLRRIPIVKRHPVMEFAEHLPILFVDNWEQVTDPAFLEQEARRIHQTAYDFSILSLSYWQTLIANHTQ